MPPLSEYLTYFTGAIMLGYLAWLLIRRIVSFVERWATRKTGAMVDGAVGGVVATEDRTPDDMAAVMDAVREGPCCDMHNQHCEPPSELCCDRCSETKHPFHAANSECVLTTHASIHTVRPDDVAAGLYDHIPTLHEDTVGRGPRTPYGRTDVHIECLKARADGGKPCDFCQMVFTGAVA